MVKYLHGLDWKLIDNLARKEHKQIKIPVKLIWGENDPTFPLEVGRILEKEFANCPGLAVIPDTKLLPHEESPEIVAREILRA